MKKTFTDNPAMNFITKPQEEEAEAQATAQPQAQATEALQDPTLTAIRRQIAEAKLAGLPEGLKVNPIFIETRTKRTNVVFPPSLFEKAKKKAESKGLSFNDYINALVELDIYKD